VNSGVTFGGSTEPATDDFFAMRGERVQRYTWVLTYVRGENVIDVGCGHGIGTYYLASQGAGRVLGVDSDPDAIEYSVRHYLRENLQFEFMDAVHPTLPRDEFDVAVSFEVLEHVNDPEGYLIGVRDTLRPGGRFFLSTPNRCITERAYRNGRSANPFHVKEYYPIEFDALLRRFFEVQHLYGQANLTVSVDDQMRYQQYDSTCRIPKSVRRIMPQRLKSYWLRRRGVPVLPDTSGQWRDYVIREVQDLAEFANQYAVQLALCVKR
jgi:SAM-dependent methyltransferase